MTDRSPDNSQNEQGLPLEEKKWYADVTRYQWMVLIIASLGWIFDVFEGQVFVASMREAMPSLVSEAEKADGNIDFYNKGALAAFLLGGAMGGIVFGMVADRIAFWRGVQVVE